MPGEYFLEKPFELDFRDNGLTIEADTTGKVIIFGGTVVSGWKYDGDKFWYAELPGVREGRWDFRALVVNGRLPGRSRIPESGYYNHLSVFNVPHHSGLGFERKATNEEATTLKYDPEDIPESLDPRNAEAQVYHMWNESMIGVARNNIQQHELIFSSPALYGMGAFGVKRYVIYNTREGMTKPGRWYLDRTNGRVVYWPLEDEDMTVAKIIAPKMEHIINIKGDAERKAENITIRGLTLQATTIPLKPAGFGAAAFDGALSIANANNCTLRDLEISNVGGLGIAATEITNCSILNCHLHDIGGGGAKMNGSGLFIARNHIHNVGLYYPSAVGLSSSGNNNHIYRNELHDIPYSGMIIGKNYITVEENLIYRVMLDVHDGGAIYASGVGNCILRGNVARDIAPIGTGYGVSSYYLDEASHDCIVEKNVSINVSRPIHNHIARNSIIRDNVFISAEDMTLSFQTSAKFAFEGNTLIAPGRISMVSPNAVSSWKNNKIFSGKSGQAYLIDSVMPSYTIPSPKTKPVEALRCEKPPVLDGELMMNEWPGVYNRLDREPSRMPNSGAPVLVKFAWDSKNLYLCALVAMKDTTNISIGSGWEKDDGIELAIKGIDRGKPATFVIRGYLNGIVQSVTDAGASLKTSGRLGKSIKYVSKIVRTPTRGWCGEWVIPLASLGLRPKPETKTAFNISAYVNEYDNWHCWEGTRGETWEVDKAGTLIFK